MFISVQYLDKRTSNCQMRKEAIKRKMEKKQANATIDVENVKQKETPFQ